MRDSDEMFEGYLDGWSSDLEDLPEGSDRSDCYKRGWRNGRDDRLRSPRPPSIAKKARRYPRR